MSIKKQLIVLYSYTWHTGARLIEQTAKLSDTDYKAHPGFGHGSIHDLFFHLLRATRSWRVALETGEQKAGIRPEDFPDLQSIQAGFDQEKLGWAALLEGLNEDDFEAELHLKNWRGEPVTFARWRVLQHITYHAMQHHTEIAALLTSKGQSPGNIDFIFYNE